MADWLWQNTDKLTKWIQAAAILGAAIWAVFTFSAAQRPSLAIRCVVDNGGFKMGREIWAGQSSCAVRFTVTIRNPGVTAFDLGSVWVRAWRIAPPNGPSGPILRYTGPGDTLAYLDLAKWESKGTLVLSTPVTYGLPRNLSADDGYTQTSTFFLGGTGDANWYLFKADALSEAKQANPLWFAVQWVEGLFKVDVPSTATGTNLGFATQWTEGLCQQ